MNRRRRKQIAFHDTPIGFGQSKIFPNNRWVGLAELIPRDLVDEKYAKNVEGSTNSNVAIDSRIAFGALIIQIEMKLSDKGTVELIQENPHCQYFLGMPEFTDAAPFDSCKMVSFRRRCPAEVMAEISEAIVQACLDRQDPPGDTGCSSGASPSSSFNQGILILDVTRTLADTSYPVDTGVLNDARVESERLIDDLHRGTDGLAEPRTYCQVAKKHYLSFARNKRPRRAFIRRILRGQLQYLRRNLRHIESLAKLNPLTLRQAEWVAEIRRIYTQQRAMYKTKKHSVAHHIVGVSQPHVPSIMRGKLGVNVEFGVKLALSLEDGYARIEHLYWEAFNESTTLVASYERYFERNRYYLEHILADKIYRSHDNLQYCSHHRNKLSGPALGHPPKDKILCNEQKRLERLEADERNDIEGKFGNAKRRYGLSRVMLRLYTTSETTIHLTVLVMNLKKRLREAEASFVYFLNVIFAITFIPDSAGCEKCRLRSCPEVDHRQVFYHSVHVTWNRITNVPLFKAGEVLRREF